MERGTQDSRLNELGARVRHSLEAAAGRDEARERARERLLAGVHAATERRHRAIALRRAIGWIALGGATAAAAAFAFAPRALTFTIADAAGAAAGELGRAIESPADAALPVSFSEGTRVVLAPATRGRVVEASRQRARVVLERGRAEANVRKGTGRRWAFDAGPFEVTVVGTRFSVSWAPEAGRFALALDEGTVVVTSACLPGGSRRVSAGERLEADCPPRPTPPAMSAPPAPRAAQPEEPPPAPVHPAAAPPPRAPDWRALLASGQPARALDAAERVGIAAIARRAQAGELLELGDTARLDGRVSTATQLLRSLRQAHPGTPAAARAAFSLGRIAFDQTHRYDDAATLFERYLAEDPNGPLVGDAWGRRLEARQRAGDRALAERDAKAYLARFPTGPYATLARALAAR